jgi:hypothetical protein
VSSPLVFPRFSFLCSIASLSRQLTTDHLYITPLFALARQDWPSTCVLNVGQAHTRFADLEGATADELLAVSCGVTGYVPESDGPDSEWVRNRDYFTPDPN